MPTCNICGQQALKWVQLDGTWVLAWGHHNRRVAHRCWVDPRTRLDSVDRWVLMSEQELIKAGRLPSPTPVDDRGWLRGIYERS